MEAILFAIAAVVCSALNCIIFKVAMKRKNYAWETLIVFHVVAVALLIGLVDIPPIGTVDSTSILLMCGGCLLWVFGDLYGVKAYEFLDASVCELYGTLKLLLIVSAGILLFGESISFLAVIGILLVVAAIALQYNADAEHNRKGVCYILLNVVLIAGALSIDKYLTTRVSEEFIIFYGFLIPMCIYVVLGYRAIPRSFTLLRDTRYMFLLAPVLGIASYACLIRALAIGDLAITYTIQETAVIFIFLFEIGLLKARKDLLARAGSCFACIPTSTYENSPEQLSVLKVTGISNLSPLCLKRKLPFRIGVEVFQTTSPEEVLKRR
jgi:drug/metabolite transporter (DMT)-like permease